MKFRKYKEKKLPNNRKFSFDNKCQFDQKSARMV